MQKANQILQAIQRMGEKGEPLTRIYRSLYSEDLFLRAYHKLYSNAGALTPGTTQETVDGMSRKRIQTIIAELRSERFRFQPVRRIQIPKRKGGTRPLGIPDFRDKLVQEVLRMLLAAYYEPRFRNSSHGFRPGRGCHTALSHIKTHFTGTKWFIEGDIRGCFDHIDHDKLLAILARDIQDGRLLNLICLSLKAGYLENWQYHRSYSGTPQGGVLSPLLSNIYLHELDAFIEDTLIPQYTRGLKRATNKAYVNYRYPIQQAYLHGDPERASQLKRERRHLPSKDPQDPHYRRLRYLRYADDFILGFAGPKAEAESIKTAIGTFLGAELHQEMSTEKTLITHARTQYAHFLGYAISLFHNDDKLTHNPASGGKARNLNGSVRLGIPYGLDTQLSKRYQRRNKAIHEAALVDFPDAQIILTYQMRFRGLAQYYQYATDIHQLGRLKWVMQQALTKTLAYKFKTSISDIYRRYRGTQQVEGREYVTLQVEVPTSKGSRTIYWGAIPLRTAQPYAKTLQDTKQVDWYTTFRSDLVQRLQANRCELCGKEGDCEVHHVHKLADLKTRWRGRKDKPDWVKRMVAMQRKTLIVCHQCHANIHAGRPTPKQQE